jgi:PAS domain S-box-containing protein
MAESFIQITNGSEALFLSALINNLPDYVYFKDRESRFLLINKALAHYFGLTDPGQAAGKTDADFFTEKHAREARADEIEIMRSGRLIVGKMEEETLASGEIRWVSTTKAPLHDAEGRLIGTFGLSRDVTAAKHTEMQLVHNEEELRKSRIHLEEMIQKRTEELKNANNQLTKEVAERRQIQESLKTSEERYRRLLAVAPTYIYTVEVNNGVPSSTDHGPGCVRVTGYAPEDYKANPNLWITMVHPEDYERVRQFAIEDLTHQKPQSSIEHRIITKSGELRWVRNTVAHHYNDRNELIRYDGLVEDITERKENEATQRESERLKAISALASGVAHSFNNIIAIISTSAASIADRLAEGTVTHDDSIRIVDATRHAKELTKRLVTVAKACETGDVQRLEPVSLGNSIDAAVALIENQFLEKNISVVIQNKEQLPYATSSNSQLLDTLVNLFVNAADAMPEGGTITVSTSIHHVNRPFHRWNSKAQPGKFVVLRVTDNGIGMDRDTQSRIFEPFFTTKKSVSSFGLGLTVVRDMVLSWGGWITFTSRPGLGTTFRVFIPLADPSLVIAHQSAQTKKNTSILIVEDDVSLRDSMKTALEKTGFQTLTAMTATEGLDLFEKNMEKISLSVVKLAFRDPSWKAALARMMELRPEATVVVTSGFSRDYVRHSLQLGAFEFLQKPFEPDQLAELASTALARRA